MELHNLPRGVTEAEIEALFNGIEVQQVVLLRGPDLGCGLVEFSDPETADSVEKVRRFVFSGLVLKVKNVRARSGSCCGVLRC